MKYAKRRLNDPLYGPWLGTYDVIHFNFGLHDLVDAGPGEGTARRGWRCEFASFCSACSVY